MKERLDGFCSSYRDDFLAFVTKEKYGADCNAIEQYIQEIHEKRSATKLAAQSAAAKYRRAAVSTSSGVSAAVDSK